MSQNYFFGCDNIPSYTKDCCVDTESGRIRAMAFVRKDFTFSDGGAGIANKTEWETGIANGQIFVIPDITGSLPAASANETRGYGDQENYVNTLSYEITFFDQNFNENCDFYDNILRSKNYYVVWVTESKVFMSGKIGTIIPTPVIPESTNEDSYWQVIAKWPQRGIPCGYDRPDDVFDCDFQ